MYLRTKFSSPDSWVLWSTPFCRSYDTPVEYDDRTHDSMTLLVGPTIDGANPKVSSVREIVVEKKGLKAQIK